jgi:Ni/Co efflux regulator RcnB
MKRIFASATALTLLLAPISAMAQPHRNDRHDDHRGPAMHGPAMHGPAMHGPRHHDWRKGGRIDRGDWNRGHRVDYRRHHLRTPPRGYEWREVDGNYVLAAAATGLIAAILLANH